MNNRYKQDGAEQCQAQGSASQSSQVNPPETQFVTQHGHIMATLSLNKTVFSVPHGMWEWDKGVGWVKNPKTISDQFSIYFVIFGTTLIFSFDQFFVPNYVKGGRGSKNVKVISEQFSSHFGQFGTTSIFLVNIFFVRNWGPKFWNSFPTNFLCISANL